MRIFSFPSIEKNNERFLFWMIALLPLIGSGITIIVAGLIVWALVSLVFKRFPWKYEPSDMPLLVACAIYIGVQFFLTAYHADSFYDYDAFLPSIIALIPFLMLPRFRATPQLDYANITFRSAVLGCFIAVVIALLQYFIFGLRAEGGDGNPLIFASVCAFLGIKSLMGLKRDNPFEKAILPLVGFCFALLAIALSGSRGPMLALLIVGSYLAIIKMKGFSGALGRHKRKFAFIGVIVVAVVALAIGMAGHRSLAEFNSNPATGNQFKSSQIRLIYLSQGADLFKQKPVLGHGASNREMTMEIASEKLTFDAGAQEIRVITSWHKYIPRPLRKYYFDHVQEKWLKNRNKQIDEAKAAGKPVPPLLEKSYLPTYETKYKYKAKHGHLHNEFMMHAVDGGLVSLISYMILLFGAVVISAKSKTWGLKKQAQLEFLAFGLVMAILAAFNVAFENDIIAVTFMLMLTAFLIGELPTIKSGQGKSPDR